MPATWKKATLIAAFVAVWFVASALPAAAQCCCRPAGIGSPNAALVQQQYALQQYALQQQYLLQQKLAASAALQRQQNAYTAIDQQQRLLYQQQQNSRLRNNQSQPSK